MKRRSSFSTIAAGLMSPFVKLGTLTLSQSDLEAGSPNPEAASQTLEEYAASISNRIDAVIHNEDVFTQQTQARELITEYYQTVGNLRGIESSRANTVRAEVNKIIKDNTNTQQIEGRNVTDINVSQLLKDFKAHCNNIAGIETIVTGTLRGHGTFPHRNVAFEPEKLTGQTEIKKIFTRPGGDWVAEDNQGNFIADTPVRAEYLNNITAGVDRIETHGVSGIIAIDKSGKAHAISPSLGLLLYQESNTPVKIEKGDQIKWVAGITFIQINGKLNIAKTKEDRPTSAIDQKRLNQQINEAGKIQKIETNSNMLLVLYEGKIKPKAFSLLDNAFTELPDQGIPEKIIDTVSGGTTDIGVIVEHGGRKRLNLIRNQGRNIQTNTKIGQEMRDATNFTSTGSLPIGTDKTGKIVLPREAADFGVMTSPEGKLILTPKKEKELGIISGQLDGQALVRIQVLTERHETRGPETVTALFFDTKNMQVSN